MSTQNEYDLNIASIHGAFKSGCTACKLAIFGWIRTLQVEGIFRNEHPEFFIGQQLCQRPASEIYRGFDAITGSRRFAENLTSLSVATEFEKDDVVSILSAVGSGIWHGIDQANAEPSCSGFV